MVSMADPWRARHFKGGYSSEWLPVGQHSWRIIRENGEVKIFPNSREAMKAGKDRFLRSLEPEIRATLPVDPEKVADKLRSEAEAWLKSNRADVQAKTSIYRPGKKQVTVIRGRS
jgi:hypothetical protein